MSEEKNYNPEDIAEITNEREKSDQAMIEGGAHYVPDKSGGSRLELTEEQISKANEEMARDLSQRAKEMHPQDVEKILKEEEPLILQAVKDLKLPGFESWLLMGEFQSRSINRIVENGGRPDWGNMSSEDKNKEVNEVLGEFWDKY